MKFAELKQITKLHFGYEEIARMLGISIDAARVSACRYVKQGLLVRLKRNLYVLRDRWESLDREEMFRIANVLQVPSYVSLMTALDYYQITTQMQRDFCESIAVKRTREIEVDDTLFNFSRVNERLYFGFRRERGFFIATPEKALLDAFYLASLKKYRFDVTSIDPGKMNASALKKMARKFPGKTQDLLRIHGYLKKTRDL
jgi:predicted transcriptional regulator of viral defense system